MMTLECDEPQSGTYVIRGPYALPSADDTEGIRAWTVLMQTTLGDSTLQMSSETSRSLLGDMSISSSLAAGILGSLGSALGSSLGGIGGAVLGAALGGMAGAVLGFRLVLQLDRSKGLRGLDVPPPPTSVRAERPDNAPEEVRDKLEGKAGSLAERGDTSTPGPNRRRAFWERLAWARRDAGITLQELSSRTGRAVSFLSQLEHGQRATVTEETIRVLAQSLEVTPEFLSEEIEDVAPNGNTPSQRTQDLPMFGKAFSQHHSSLDSRTREQLVYGTVEQRVEHVVLFLCRTFPAVFTIRTIAYELGLTTRSLLAMMGSAEVSHWALQRLVSLTGIPMCFFAIGQLQEPPAHADDLEATTKRYMDAIRMAHEKSMPPEELMALINGTNKKRD